MKIYLCNNKKIFSQYRHYPFQHSFQNLDLDLAFYPSNIQRHNIFQIIWMTLKSWKYQKPDQYQKTVGINSMTG